jgi:hypothetical protein
MKVFAVHDEAGNILGLAIPSEDAEDGEFGLVAEAGQYVTEIDVPDPSEKQRPHLLEDLARNYRVERATVRGRLIARRVQVDQRPNRETGEPAR